MACSKAWREEGVEIIQNDRKWFVDEGTEQVARVRERTPMQNSGDFTCSGNQDSLKDFTEKWPSPVCILGTRPLATDVKDGLDEGGGGRRAC